MSSELSRRALLVLFAPALASAQLSRLKDAPPPGDWMCPMDPDYHADKPGVCPRCGMKLVLHVPDRVEYPLELLQSPELVKPGDSVTLTFRVLDPETGRPVTSFEIVHEKLMHLFVVSENLE